MSLNPVAKLLFEITVLPECTGVMVSSGPLKVTLLLPSSNPTVGEYLAAIADRAFTFLIFDIYSGT